MRPIVFVLMIVFFPCVAQEAFQVPRSQVVELTDPKTKRVYPIFIKVPRTHGSQGDKTYPVIYLMDGSYSFQLASGATRFPMNSGAMQEAIIVAVSYEQGSRGSASRVRDYTPTTAEQWKMETGGASAHAALLRNVVFPYVEQHYRVDKTARTFVGNSLGGLFGAYILFDAPDMFNSYILGSPSVWFDSNSILNQTTKPATTPVKVYVAVGELERPEFGEGQDMVDGARQLVKKIKAQSGDQVTLIFNIISGAKHTTAFPTTLVQGLDWIYATPD